MSLVVGTWNVKDLLDPLESERVHHAAKVRHLAAVMARLDADVIALQEVGSLTCIRSVLEAMGPSGYEPVFGTPDARGIACAVLSRLPIASAQVHTAERLGFPVFQVGDPPPFGERLPLRRGVVHVRVLAPGLGEVDLVCCHFKSQRPVPLCDPSGAPLEPSFPAARAAGELRALVLRTAEALFVRELVDALLHADPQARVVVLGDLNDHPGSPTVRTVCGRGDGELRPCADRVPPERRFSVLFEGAPQQIDHILCTQNLYERVTAAEFLNADLRDHGTLLPDEHVPDSDHAPFLVRFDER